MKLQDIDHIGILGTGLMGLIIVRALGGFPLHWGFAPERRLLQSLAGFFNSHWGTDWKKHDEKFWEKFDKNCANKTEFVPDLSPKKWTHD